MRDLLIVLVVAIAMIGLGSASNTQPHGIGNHGNVELNGFTVTPGAYGELNLAPSAPTQKNGVTTEKVSIENPLSDDKDTSYFGLRTYPEGEAHSKTTKELYDELNKQFVSDQSHTYLTSGIEVDYYPAVRTDLIGPDGKVVETLVIVILSPTEELRMILKDPELIENLPYTKINGYDENGFDKWGYDINGYDENGLDVDGNPRATNPTDADAQSNEDDPWKQYFG
ncbi:MAG: hypothetical protein NTY37_10450 [Methanothrix sp.]|nr:hypothetical protein [Methanothrix sp.]